LTPDELLPIAQEDGIPIAWVPPPSVLKALAAAPRDRRYAVLLDNRDLILNDCGRLTSQCTDPWISNERTLLIRAIDAFNAGHHEAAMALAVALGEGLALWASEPRVIAFDSKADAEAWEKVRTDKRNHYKLAQIEIEQFASDSFKRDRQTQRLALISPIPRFFAPFYGKPGESVPDTVSRHATVHRPTISHFSELNAVLAIMLAVSFLRDQEEWSQEVRHDDANAAQNDWGTETQSEE
jgi:hypothetical protein